MSKWRQKLQRKLIGRNGPDDFSRFLVYLSIISLIIGVFAKISAFTWIALFLLFYSYFRIFSRNTAKRYKENQQFKEWFEPITKWYNNLESRFRNRKTHRYYKCPSCKQELRVPKGKGTIRITCPKCGNQFEKKS